MSRKKSRHSIASTFTALSFLFLYMPAAFAGEPVGYVESKRGASGEVWIVRNGKRLAVTAGTPLEARDELHVTGRKNQIVVRGGSFDGAKRIRASNSPLLIGEPKDKSLYDQARTVLSNLAWAVGITDRKSQANTFARSGSAGEATSYDRLQNLAILDATTLYAVDGSDKITVRWCGDAGGVELRHQERPRYADVTDPQYGSATLTDFSSPNASAPDDLVILPLGGEDQELSYRISWIDWDAVPRPLGQDTASDLSDEAKTRWAKWLLADESGTLGNAYNLIAINLLVDARDGFWPAAYILEQATYCPDSSLN